MIFSKSKLRIYWNVVSMDRAFGKRARHEWLMLNVSFIGS